MSGIGTEMHNLATKLWPICRSITGDGVRQTLAILQDSLPGITIHEIPSGTKCFDWVVPPEWKITDAYIIDPSGKKIIDFKKNNLHVVGYSVPVDQEISLEDLQNHLYSLPGQPDAIPYITSYYKERWGFCISHKQRETLVPGKYRVKITSSLFNGHLTYGELIIPGKSGKEIFLSTYICHPSMANNELSGPCVAAFLGKWIKEIKERQHTFRIVFIPETIGSICYISRNLESLKKNVVAGFVLTCIGDDRVYSFLPSRNGDTIADKAAIHALKHIDSNFKKYSFLNRGSDERQYCSPGVDLPIASIMRSKYGEYPEYHTSLDDLNFVTPSGLEGGFNAVKRTIEILEKNRIPAVTTLCEPQLGKRGLYPTLSTKETGAQVRNMMDFIAYSDGNNTLLEIADMINQPFWTTEQICSTLEEHGLILSSPISA